MPLADNSPPILARQGMLSATWSVALKSLKAIMGAASPVLPNCQLLLPSLQLPEAGVVFLHRCRLLGDCKPRTALTQHVIFPGRCAVCVVQRKGKCGSLSAPNKCRRKLVLAVRKQIQVCCLQQLACLGDWYMSAHAHSEHNTCLDTAFQQAVTLL